MSIEILLKIFWYGEMRRGKKHEKKSKEKSSLEALIPKGDDKGQIH